MSNLVPRVLSLPTSRLVNEENVDNDVSKDGSIFHALAKISFALFRNIFVINLLFFSPDCRSSTRERLVCNPTCGAFLVHATSCY